jgi:hypothetical protein
MTETTSADTDRPGAGCRRCGVAINDGARTVEKIDRNGLTVGVAFCAADRHTRSRLGRGDDVVAINRVDSDARESLVHRNGLRRLGSRIAVLVADVGRHRVAAVGQRLGLSRGDID